MVTRCHTGVLDSALRVVYTSWSIVQFFFSWRHVATTDNIFSILSTTVVTFCGFRFSVFFFFLVGPIVACLIVIISLNDLIIHLALGTGISFCCSG